MKVLLKSFSMSVSLKTNPQEKQRYSVNASGEISRPGAYSKFVYQLGPNKTTLQFMNAVIFDGSDPVEVAKATKNALVAFMQVSDEIPEKHRQTMIDLVYNHHKR